MPNEQFEQLELLGGQGNLTALALNAELLGIDRNRAVIKLTLRITRRGRFRPLIPAANRFDAGQQFARTERLHHVIVAADFETDHAIDFVAAGGKKNHRHIGKRAHDPADFEPVDIRQSDIENDETRRGVPRDFRRFASTLGRLHLVALRLERILQHIRNARIIFDDQDVHFKEP